MPVKQNIFLLFSQRHHSHVLAEPHPVLRVIQRALMAHKVMIDSSTPQNVDLDQSNSSPANVAAGSEGLGPLEAT